MSNETTKKTNCCTLLGNEIARLKDGEARAREQIMQSLINLRADIDNEIGRITDPDKMAESNFLDGGTALSIRRDATRVNQSHTHITMLEAIYSATSDEEEGLH